MAALYFDVGNTSVKAGLWDGAVWSRVERFPSEPAAAEGWAERLRELAAASAVERAGLASVSPGVSAPIVAGVRQAFGVETPTVHGTMPVPAALAPFRTGYGTPDTLGADRLAVAAALFRSRTLDDRAVIAVDAGTALTLDVVTAEGVHLGGAILPGPGSLVRALARGTAQLPEVPFEPPASPIGSSTVTSIRSGVVFLLLDGLAGLLGRTAAEVGGPYPEVVATGGWGTWLAEHMPGHIDRVEPNLVLDGVRLLTGGE